MLKKKDILGVKIDDINIDQAVERVDGWLQDKGKHYIVTPNPEFIMAAQRDLVFRKILSDADLSIPDGIALKLGNLNLKNRVAGVDLMERLIKLSAEKGYTVGFLGGKVKLAHELAECLESLYPGLKVSSAVSNVWVDMDGEVVKELEPLRFKPTDILFVSFGQVKQEKWIALNLNKYPVKVMMGVGGSFDFLSGYLPRAPKLLRKIGLEWLFRLLMQPQRIKRYPALVKYLGLCLLRLAKT